MYKEQALHKITKISKTVKNNDKEMRDNITSNKNFEKGEVSTIFYWKTKVNFQLRLRFWKFGKS